MSIAELPSAPLNLAGPTGDQPPRTFAQQAFIDTFSNWRARLGAFWIVLLAFAAVFAPFLANSHPYLLKVDGRWSSPLLEHLAPVDVILLVGALTAMALLAMRSAGVRAGAMALVWMVALTTPLALWKVAWRNWDVLSITIGAPLAWALLLVVCLVIVGALVWTWRGMGRQGMVRWPLLAAGAILAAILIARPVDPPRTVVYEHYREMERAGRVQFILRSPIPYSASDRMRDSSQHRLLPPSWWGGDARRVSTWHWMGTDVNSSDVLSRIIHASRIALAIGFISTGIAVVIGVVIGGIMGFFVGRVDIIGMRLVEIFEAIPTLFLLIAFVAFFGRNLYLMMAIIGLVTWTGDARFIRAEFLKLRNQDFVQAAIAAGLPLRSVLFRHMLPNGITPVLVAASFGVASAILYEATLSFLGLGLVDEPSWGQMLEQARTLGRFTWWMAIFPGMAIFLTVFAYNLVGESFRDAIDPRIRKL